MKTLLLPLFFILSISVFAAPNPIKEASERSLNQLTVGEMTQMNVREFQEATGQKFSLKEKITYGIFKKRLKKDVKRGAIPADMSAAQALDDIDMNWGAFALGFIFGILGFLVVILLFDDHDAWKSALIGFGIWIGLLILFAL